MFPVIGPTRSDTSVRGQMVRSFMVAEQTDMMQGVCLLLTH